MFLSPPDAFADISRDFNTGVYLYKKGDFDLAARTFEMILSKYPGDHKTDEVMFWYGECHYHLGKYGDALGIYKKLAAEYPNSQHAVKSLFSAGFAAMKLEHFRDAASFFAQVAGHTAASRDMAVESRIIIAECFLKMGNDQEAERALRDLLATPKIPSDRRQEAEYDLGQLLRRMGRVQEGRESLLRAAEKTGPHQADALMAVGDEAYTEGRYKESLEWYEKIFRKIRGASTDARSRAIYNGAWSYLGLGQMDKARALFNEVLEDKTALPEVRGDAALRLAYLNREKGTARGIADAEQMALTAEKIAEESQAARLKDDVAMFRAESAFLEKKFDEALAFLSRMTDKGYRVQRLMGQIFFESGRPADAALYFERAAVAAPSRPALNLCLFDMAQSLFSAARYDSSVDALGRIKDPSPELDERLKPFLADALHHAGRFKEAARQYDRLAAEAPDPAAAQRYRYFGALSHFHAKYFTQAGKNLTAFFEKIPRSGAQDARGDTDAGRSIEPPFALGDGVYGDSVATAALILRGDILAAQKNFAEAHAAYLRAIPAAQTVGRDNIFLAYSHLIDFAADHAADRLLGHIDAFVSAMQDSPTYLFVIDRLYTSGLYKQLLIYTEAILKKYSPTADVYGKAAYYEMMAHYRRGEMSAAEKSLAALSKWAGRNPSTEIAEEAQFWMARFAQARNDRAMAKSSYLSYLDLYPTGKYVSDAHFNIGLMALEAASPSAEEAERHLGKMLAEKSAEDITRDPLLAGAQYNMASVRILQDRFEEAERILEPLQKSPSYQTDPAYLYKLGYVKVRLEKTAEAETFFRSVLAKSKVPAGTFDNTLHALLSMLYRAERYKELEMEFKNHVKRVGDKVILARIRYLMGMTLFDGEKYADAMVYFKDVKPPGDTEIVIEAAMRMADCDYNLRRYKPALDRYSKIAESHPTTRWGKEALYASGLCKIKLGFPESALTGFERFLQQNPDDPLARDVAMEAAKLYLSRGDLDASEQKLDFLERRKVDGTFLEDSMKMRIQIWRRRGDSDKVLTLARSYRGAYGQNADIALAAAEAAIKLGRSQEALEALEGFDPAATDTPVLAFMDFYRAEAMLKLGKDGAVDLYRKLLDSSDTEIRISSRYRYGSVLMERKDFAASRELFGSILSDPAGKSMPFFRDVIMKALGTAKEAGRPAEVSQIYAAHKKDIEEEQNKIVAAEFNLWAQIALKDNTRALAAIDDLLSLPLDVRRRSEVLLAAAQLHETTGNPDKADAIYTGVLNNPDAQPEFRGKAEARKIQLAMSRGVAGRPILESYLSGGPTSSAAPPQGEWAVRAAESLLSAAVEDKRYADIIRIVDMIQTRFSKVRPAARYASAVARLGLSDTAGAILDFRKVADGASTESFYISWSAYRVGVEELAQKNMPDAKKYFKSAWKGRENLDGAAALNTYQRLVEMFFESSDFESIQALAADPPPAGAPSAAHLLNGMGAWAVKDYAAASRHLKEITDPSDKIRMLYAESLTRINDIPAAIMEYEKVAEGHGEPAGRAQILAADLLASAGKTSEGLIGYYKVLAVYESDTSTDLAAESLLKIARLYAAIGDTEKARTAAEDLMKKYPDSRGAREAATVR